jgi:prepilin-type N-terminal cleavage/methylation domain-containing protein
MKNNNKGFTLAELLIVVAIIAVLVAISIPIFSKQMEKSREAVDLANLRSAYAAGRYQLMENNSGKSPETYIYDPESGELLAPADANNVGESLFCGKGTSIIGNKENKQTITWNGQDVVRYSESQKKMLVGGTSGMLYDPSEDVSGGDVITVTIYPPNNTVIAYFYHWG